MLLPSRGKRSPPRRIEKAALLQRLPVTALSAPATKNPSFAQDAFVSAAAFHCSCIQRAKRVHDVIECYGLACLRRSTPQARYGLDGTRIGSPGRQDRS